MKNTAVSVSAEINEEMDRRGDVIFMYRSLTTSYISESILIIKTVETEGSTPSPFLA